MALQIRFTKNHKENFPLSYKDYELSKKAFESYKWDKIEETDDRFIYYGMLNIPNVSLNKQLHVKQDVVVERNKEYPLYICDDCLFVNDYKYFINKIYSKIDNTYLYDKFFFSKINYTNWNNKVILNKTKYNYTYIRIYYL